MSAVVREDIDLLHSECLALARRTARLAAELDRGVHAATAGRLYGAVREIWQASELLHAAFHHAPSDGPSIARLCGRRMRYLAARVSRRRSR
ncbi:MAG TPA: DUF6238 family protein [Streptomyces sp.]